MELFFECARKWKCDEHKWLQIFLAINFAALIFIDCEPTTSFCFVGVCVVFLFPAFWNEHELSVILVTYVRYTDQALLHKYWQGNVAVDVLVPFALITSAHQNGHSKYAWWIHVLANMKIGSINQTNQQQQTISFKWIESYVHKQCSLVCECM